MERKSAGLRARRMTEADLEPLHRLLSDPEVMRYLEPPFSREQTRAFLERAGLTPEPLILAVDDGGFAGYVIWHPYDDVSMELGWVLDRSRWGRGYAGELTRLLTDRARRQGRGVVIECVPEQTVTRHIAEKSGFRFCGMAEGCDLYCAEAVLALRVPAAAGRKRTALIGRLKRGKKSEWRSVSCAILHNPDYSSRYAGSLVIRLFTR